ncbi:MAG: hypothetical protein A3A86_03190, partial [Elusimicrobia bacterium RIFCSPLOWO2_01_FULL_60_11]
MSILFAAGALAAWGMPAVAGADDAGKKIYDTKCTACHGADGKGKAAMAKMFKVDVSAMNLASDAVAAMKDEDLLKVIADGKNKMPAYGKQLSAEEQKSVAQYLRQLSGKGAQSKPAEPKTEEAKAPAAVAPAVSEAAKAEYAKSCATCHAKDAKGNAAMAKMFKADPSALNLTDDASLAKSDQD